MMLPGENYVTSYPNPDTDGVVCTIALAKYLSRVRGEVWRPLLLGKLSGETRYVLNVLGMEEPELADTLPDSGAVALVDTHHRSQLPENFPFGKVQMVVDHHPGGDDELFVNGEILNEPVGAAASLVARLYLQRGDLDPKMLALLGYGILSNTLNFTAPSTSGLDREMLAQIRNTVSIDEDIATGMFGERSSVLRQDAYTALCSDLKMFDTQAGEVCISQLEAYGLEEGMEVSQIGQALERIAGEKRVKYCLFNGVDIKTRRSLVVSANGATRTLLSAVFQREYPTEPLVFDRILLRKTDFVPGLNRIFSEK